MKLFVYKDYNLRISDEAYALRPFKRLVDRDRTKEKTKAMKELAYLYFMYDPRSDFSFEIIESDRDLRVKDSIGLEADWKPDKQVQEAIELYKYLTTSSSSLLLQDTRVIIDNIRSTFRSIDLTEKDANGKLVFNIGQVMTAVKQVPSLIKELADAEKAVSKEIEEMGTMRGMKQKSILEDGLTNFLNYHDSSSN